MSAAAVLGIVLIIGFVGVALVASIGWRKRMQESIPRSGPSARPRADATPQNWPERS